MTTDQIVTKAEVGWLDLAKQLGKVADACRIMGHSRDSLYRFKEPQSSEDRCSRSVGAGRIMGIASRPRWRMRASL
jgi:hypothetical protein